MIGPVIGGLCPFLGLKYAYKEEEADEEEEKEKEDKE